MRSVFSVNLPRFCVVIWFALGCPTFSLAVPNELESTVREVSVTQMENDFAAPDAEYRPWVYWFWNNGNLTREGITADLEAMQRVGIRGVLIMEVGQGAPRGPVDFLSDTWRELFTFMLAEAERLDIEVNMNNDPGWNGSGGAWIRPDEAMQVLTWTETQVAAGEHVKIQLPEPVKRCDYYQDIVVLAFPTPSAQTVKSTVPVDENRRHSLSNAADVPTSLAKTDVVDVTKQLQEGTFDWVVPTAKSETTWTILRMGHTCKGIMVAPAPEGGVGLECDKLSIKGTDAAFAGQIGRLSNENAKLIGRTFISTHIDSWENGSQNWTSLMREEFQARRGYDLLTYLPIFAGYLVDNQEMTDRFLWDFRKTVSEMVMENHVTRMKTLAHQHGLKLSIEAYGSPCDHIQYGGIADEPMGEFWIGGGAIGTCRGMASAGHVYGKTIVGAEAFTAGDSERWLEYPGSIKALGDQVLCEGINRFVFHRYSFQPWKDVRPGLMMGPWGIHYERTQTWWEQTPAWHDYLTRCQYLLRQGNYVADICYVEPEDSPQGFTDHPHNGYPWDSCGTDAVLQMSVQDGWLRLPSGMRYRILVLPDSDQMTLPLLQKVSQLVCDGAIVIGRRPVKAHGLVNYPQNDEQVNTLATELWGETVTQAGLRTIGKGTLIWGRDVETVLEERCFIPDLTVMEESPHWIHRRTSDADIYFVANPESWSVLFTATFRATGTPEFWSPKTGKRTPVVVQKSDVGATTLLIPLEATESVFVVFRHPSEWSSVHSAPAPTITSIERDGETLFNPEIKNTRIHIQSASYGVPGDANAQRDATRAVQELVNSGQKAIRVRKITEMVGDPKYLTVKTLTVNYEIDGVSNTVSASDGGTVYLNTAQPAIEVVTATYGPAGDATRTVDVRELIQKMADAGERRFLVTEIAARHGDPAVLVVKTLQIEYRCENESREWIGTDGQMVDLRNMSNGTLPFRISNTETNGLEIWESGQYTFVQSSGETIQTQIDLPQPQELIGPWSVDFSEKEMTMEKLLSWSQLTDESLKYYSGTAVYTHLFTVEKSAVNAMQNGRTRMILDLGRVEVIAEVKLNNRILGTLWTKDKTIDVTELLDVDGENVLEIRVTNLWVNRLIGDAFLPDCSERQANGTLSAWPQWLQNGEKDTTGRQTFCMWNLWSKTDTPIMSGLIGPVRLRCVMVLSTP
ncbi:MAG: glycosyl hydrolase [Thermoguttaceae bacterium]|nr:glycosyl hydrolase [Thermoguttaceae bacterium]